MATSTSKDAYTAQELAGMLSVTERAIQMRAKREAWTSRVRPVPGGGRGFEWLVTSMPETTRVAIQIAEAKACAAQLKKRQAVDARRDELLQHRARAMATLTAKERARAEAKATVYRAWLDYDKECGLSRTEALASFCALYNAGGAGLAVNGDVLAVVRHVSPNTIRSIGQRLLADGLGGLAGVYGRHRVGTGRIDAQPEILDYVRGAVYEFPHIRAAMLLEGLQGKFGKRTDLQLPAVRTLQQWLARWRASQPGLHLNLTDPDAFRSHNAFALGNAAYAINALNQRWEMDSTPGDILLEGGQRHTIVGCIDVYSRRAKLLVSRSSSSAAVCGLLHRCLLDWGVPEEVGTDNGTDYVSTQVATALLDLDVHQDIAPPFTPEHKPFIERFFGTMLRDIFEILEGFCGHNVAQAQAIRNRTSFAKRLYPGKRNEDAGTVDLRMTPEQLQALLDRWCEDRYAMRPHGGLGGRTPYEVAQAWSGPLHHVADDAALAVLLLPLVPGVYRKVTKKGVAVEGAQYWDAALATLVDIQVQVRRAESDIRYVYLFDEEGRYICRAADLTLPEISIADLSKEARRLQKRNIAEQRKELRNAARRQNVREMSRDVMAAAAEHAAEVRAQAVQPAAPSVLYTTPALMEAGKAARAGDAPVVDMNASQQADMALGARIAAQAQRPKRFQDRLAELGPAERWKEWELLDARKKAGGTLTPDEASWHAMYPTGSEGLGFWITKHGLPEHMRRRVHG